MNQGDKFYAFELLDRLKGGQVRFVQEVTRGPWIIPEGTTGILLPPCHTSHSLIFAAVKLDDPPATLAEEYDGEIHWIEDDTLFDIQRDVTITPPVR